MAITNSQNTTNEAQKNLLALPEGIELGSYRIIRSLGQGGFGITYLAENIKTGQQVVIKENLPSFCAMRDRSTLQVSATNPNDPLQEYPKLLTRFVEEARLLARLDHPNIVKVLDAFEALGTAYYVMPWLGGKELHQAAPTPENMTETWLQPILRTMLGALQYLHRNNIYHRDVKPGNILLTEDGTPVLIDFGTARAIISERSATLVGSPGYSPIEQMRAHGKRGPWTDIYSLGATCYRLITGKNPPEAFDRVDEDDDPLRPLANRAELFGRFSPAFLATIDKALAIRGKNRWQSTDEWLAALPAPPVRTETRTAQPVPPPATVAVTSIGTTPISVLPELSPRKLPHATLILGAVLALVLALAIPGGYLLYQYGQESAEQRILDTQARPETEQEAHDSVGSKLREKGISEYQYNNKIVDAAKNNDIELLSLLIAAGADVNVADQHGYSPGIWAARNGHTQCLDHLLNAPGINVNQPDKGGYTPLNWAAWEGHTECVRRLLTEPGINVNQADTLGYSPLFMATTRKHTECVELLLDAPGINVNQPDKGGYTPLNWAAGRGHAECVQLLLAAPGIDVNKASEVGYTPLCNAAAKGHTECVKLLLAAPGIDVNKASEWGSTPLHWAALEGNTECVRLLLAAPGIDVNKADRFGDTPLKAAEKNKHSECARLLRQAGGR